MMMIPFKILYTLIKSPPYLLMWGKCKVMHFGYNNPSLEYTMGGEKLMMTESEKDLGVIHGTLKPAAHIANCVKKANQMLGMIQRTITYKNKRILLFMYNSLVRPHLEYAVQAWSPHQLGHIRLIEGVQCRFTSMIPELNSLTGSNDNSLQVVELSGLQTCKLLSTHPSKPFLQRFSRPESVCSG